ncbi:hypothetical protein HYH03_006696 [Edaphochlamys debaryana]|uniref:ABM domain-containing protein n=1 Tax=Edaphochlamys debaryana TaxID=47281 RepID=A0A836BZV7_9CHLO|nr:hypothetical protein HYH03_006696 [Edaphochlamys debaryana]|eukprot:KAG2495085.1 hypothetical protein HYH03_006696 [Edaphochlamys debaryana]
MPLSKLSETANAVWERLKASGLNVAANPVLGGRGKSAGPAPSPNKTQGPGPVPGPSPTPGPASAPSPNPGAAPGQGKSPMQSADALATFEPRMPSNLVGGSSGSSSLNGGPRSKAAAAAEADLTELARGVPSGGKEAKLVAALQQAQEEKRELSDKTEVLRASISMLEAKNAKMAKEVASVEASREMQVRQKDMLLAERDDLAAQLAAAKEQLEVATATLAARDEALDALRRSQMELQLLLKDGVARLRAADKSADELRSQLATAEASRASAGAEKDTLSAALRDLVGSVDQLLRSTDGTTSADEAGPAPAPGVQAPSGETGIQQVEALRSAMQDSFAALKTAREEAGLMRAENAQLAQKAKALAATNAELAATAESLKVELAETKSALAEQRAAAEAAQARERELAAALAEAQAAIERKEELETAVQQLSTIQAAAQASGLGLVELAQMATQVNSFKEQLRSAKASETDLKRRLAGAEVALLDARRETAAVESRLATELGAARSDADTLRASLHSRTLAQQAAKRAAGGVPKSQEAKAAGQFVNTNRFYVRPELMYDFVKAVAARELSLVEAQGFLNIAVRNEPGNVMVVATHWESIPAFEAWSNSAGRTRHHYPSGVMQYVPKRGEGFPEDYIPFKDLTEPVNAKYD